MKNKIILMLLVFVFFSCETTGEDKYNIESLFLGKGYLNIYEAIEPSQQEPIFIDEFENNANLWTVGTATNYNLSINNGLYNLKHLHVNYTGNYWVYKNINISNDIDFQYEVRAKSIDNSNPTKNGNYVFLGFSDSYVFSINNSLSNVLLKFGIMQTNSNFEDILTAPINSDFNVYTLRKIKDKLSVFINGVFIKTFEVKQIDYKAGFGFTNELYVDYIRINKLNL